MLGSGCDGHGFEQHDAFEPIKTSVYLSGCVIHHPDPISAERGEVRLRRLQRALASPRIRFDLDAFISRIAPQWIRAALLDGNGWTGWRRHTVYGDGHRQCIAGNARRHL